MKAAAALLAMLATATAPAPSAFDMVVLGARGGIEDGNLTAFMIHPHGDSRAVTCDAGTLVQGLRVAAAKGTIGPAPAGSGLSPVGYALTHDIKGYLISHAHLDHVGGLIVASPDDSAKPIYALPSVNAEILRSYFRNGPWSNFTDRGEPPRLGKYHVADLVPGATTPLADTAMAVTAFPLQHGPLESTAFLVEHGQDGLLCFGDTGADSVEHSDKLRQIWTAVAERVRAKRLKAIIIEVSFASARPDDKLFGHLTPRLLLAELHTLEGLAGKGSLQGLPIVVSHIKYSLTDTQPQKQILAELQAGNDLGVRFVVPEQGQRLRF